LADMRSIHSRARRRYDVKSATGKPAAVKFARPGGVEPTGCSAVEASWAAPVETAGCSAGGASVEAADCSTVKPANAAPVEATKTAGMEAAATTASDRGRLGEIRRRQRREA